MEHYSWGTTVRYKQFHLENPLERKAKEYITLAKQLNVDSDELEKHLALYKERLLLIQNDNGYKLINKKVKEEVTECLVKIEMMLGSQECSIQIPSNDDLESMRGMSAADKEDQRVRQKNMVKVLNELPFSIPIYSTQILTLGEHWELLFNAINDCQFNMAIEHYYKIPKDDFIFEPLLKVHTEEYLHQIIKNSIDSQDNFVNLDPDLVYTPRTFEILIRDLANTLSNQSKLLFSFGLPTHHAYGDKGSGFCFINKTAVLMRSFESAIKNNEIQFIVVGTDVNRDNGLCDILRSSAAYLHTCHIDIFDSRVYPHHNHETIHEEFGGLSIDNNEGILFEHAHNYDYYAVDLSVKTRESTEAHPALQFALDKTQETIDNAIFNGQKIVFLLPTGWDSHQNETANCGKYVDDDHWLSADEAQKTRFNDFDLKYFYAKIAEMYVTNKDHIEKVYWGLEGGYAKKMYEHQIKLMMQVVNEDMVDRQVQHAFKTQ